MLWACAALGKGLVLFEQEVVECLIPFRQHHSHAAEAGGILIGYRRSEHLHVVDATTPGASDRRSRYEFQRRDPVHQYTALALWERSRQMLDYLGEWHTHPEAYPSPSCIDTSEWAKIMRNRRMPMIFAILGQHAWWVGVGREGRVVPAFRAAD